MEEVTVNVVYYTRIQVRDSFLSIILIHAPINGKPHLAYLGQILEKGGGFAVRIFPEGLVLCRDCPNLLNHILLSFIVLSVFGKFFVNFTDNHISLSHTVHNREVWAICEGYVGE